jgi:hypothetical protein
MLAKEPLPRAAAMEMIWNRENATKNRWVCASPHAILYAREWREWMR